MAGYAWLEGTAEMHGFVQIYTGDGKGKTTAALGLAIRAAGAGLRVFILQFIKKGPYSEIKALRRFSDRIAVEQFGTGRFIRGNPRPADIAAARRGLVRARAVMASGRWQVLILEEANVAASLGLIAVQDLLDLIAARPPDLELVITGRNASEAVMEKADLVTEMRALKHYYTRGIRARIGIEK